MKRLFLACLLAVIGNALNAQTEGSTYKVLKNGLSGSLDMADKTFNSGEVIDLKEASSFDFQRSRNGKSAIVRVSNKYGRYEVDSLFRIAQNEIVSRRNNKSSRVSKPSSQRKDADSTIYGFINKIASFIGGKYPELKEYGDVDVSRSQQLISVTNISDIDMFVDIIWVSRNHCMSAISFMRDFANNSILYPGETLNYSVNEYIADKELFVVCTPYPIEYNTIDLSQVNERDYSYDEHIPLTMCAVKHE